MITEAAFAGGLRPILPSPHREVARVRSLFEDKKTIAVLAIPPVAIMLFAIMAPLLVSLYFSFMKWTGFGAIKFIGLSNYVELLTADKVFVRSLLNAVALMFVTIFLQNPVAFAVAATLTHLGEKSSRLLRTIYFIPATLSLWWSPSSGSTSSIPRTAYSTRS